MCGSHFISTVHYWFKSKLHATEREETESTVNTLRDSSQNKDFSKINERYQPTNQTFLNA